MTRPVLVTGFKAFGTTPVNPAEQVARALDGALVVGRPVIGITVENSFGRSVEQVESAMEHHDPEIVVMLGEYGGRATITVERVATNYDDAARYDLRDNAGAMPAGIPQRPDGPAARFAGLPVKRIVRAIRDAGVPADVSDTAGTNVCNHLFYGVLDRIEAQAATCRAGFVHLPHLPEVAALEEHLGAPSMSMQTATTGVRAAIAAAVRHTDDDEVRVVSRWQI